MPFAAHIYGSQYSHMMILRQRGRWKLKSMETRAHAFESPTTLSVPKQLVHMGSIHEFSCLSLCFNIGHGTRDILSSWTWRLMLADFIDSVTAVSQKSTTSATNSQTLYWIWVLFYINWVMPQNEIDHVLTIWFDCLFVLFWLYVINVINLSVDIAPVDWDLA